ncbi:LOW QUALITY PROTEIN: hypothetical protein PHPALM_5272 [Phytophthora palmivora]|uniref:C2H2-type domain-containing protein n=1 Tax=Phytophthora palmivora TaxID=4796 RepID=A0A2P4YHQ8_9STRA|nr:LOW QUALITY PROTEIN: hypothetical protein PHPALM_5272 [Phytophthora palmivora]
MKLHVDRRAPAAAVKELRRGLDVLSHEVHGFDTGNSGCPEDSASFRGGEFEQRKPFKCELCQARFTYKHGLTRHMKRSHRNVNVPFECAECLMAFKKKSELQAHSTKSPFLNTFKFPLLFVSEYSFCLSWANAIASLTRLISNHKQTEHNHRDGEDTVHDDADATENSPTHVCLVCDQTFSRKQYLRAHLRTHFESQRIVECKLNHRKLVRPGPRCCCTDTAQSIFEHAVDSLRLTIRLRMVRS